MSGYGSKTPNTPCGSDRDAPYNQPDPDETYEACPICGVAITVCDAIDFIEDGARKLGDEYVHESCSRRYVAKSLSEEERFQVARLVAALRVIDSLPGDLLKKLDQHTFFDDLNLQDLKDLAVAELGNLYGSASGAAFLKEPDALGHEEMMLVRRDGVCRANVALGGAISGAARELEAAVDMAPSRLRDTLLGVRSDRHNFLVQSRLGLREATHA